MSPARFTFAAKYRHRQHSRGANKMDAVFIVFDTRHHVETLNAKAFAQARATVVPTMLILSVAYFSARPSQTTLAPPFQALANIPSPTPSRLPCRVRRPCVGSTTRNLRLVHKVCRLHETYAGKKP